jgi:hypothetical protein
VAVQEGGTPATVQDQRQPAAFGGYDFRTLVKPYRGGGLLIRDGIASSGTWVALAGPDAPHGAGLTGTRKNRDHMLRLLGLCQRYVERQPGILRRGVQPDAATYGIMRLVDPRSGDAYTLPETAYAAFVGVGDVVLPVYYRRVWVMVVKGDTVAAVIGAATDGGRTSHLPRLTTSSSHR